MIRQNLKLIFPDDKSAKLIDAAFDDPAGTTAFLMDHLQRHKNLDPITMFHGIVLGIAMVQSAADPEFSGKYKHFLKERNHGKETRV